MGEQKAHLYVNPQRLQSRMCELLTQSWSAPCKSFVTFKAVSILPFTECFASTLPKVKTQVILRSI
jgi:hypothetical protein